MYTQLSLHKSNLWDPISKSLTQERDNWLRTSNSCVQTILFYSKKTRWIVTRFFFTIFQDLRLSRWLLFGGMSTFFLLMTTKYKQVNMKCEVKVPMLPFVKRLKKLKKKNTQQSKPLGFWNEEEQRRKVLKIAPTPTTGGQVGHRIEADKTIAF